MKPGVYQFLVSGHEKFFVVTCCTTVEVALGEEKPVMALCIERRGGAYLYDHGVKLAYCPHCGTRWIDEDGRGIPVVYNRTFVKIDCEPGIL